MRTAWVVVLLAAAMGCQLGTRKPVREQTRPYDLAPQSGYLAEGSTVNADYAAPAESKDKEARFDEASYRAAIQKDLVRINALMAENDRLRQELAATTLTLEAARDEVNALRETIARLEAKLARAEERAARRAKSAQDNASLRDDMPANGGTDDAK
jgi:septal ring factor EnvC (AmiA/AmiB activator)